MLIPRSVKFLNGKAVGIAPQEVYHDSQIVMFLPTTHYDFVEYNVLGKTEGQIIQEINLMLIADSVKVD